MSIIYPSVAHVDEWANGKEQRVRKNGKRITAGHMPILSKHWFCTCGHVKNCISRLSWGKHKFVIKQKLCQRSLKKKEKWWKNSTKLSTDGICHVLVDSSSTIQPHTKGIIEHEIQIKRILSTSLGMIMYGNEAYFLTKVSIHWL